MGAVSDAGALGAARAQIVRVGVEQWAVCSGKCEGVSLLIITEHIGAAHYGQFYGQD